MDKCTLPPTEHGRKALASFWQGRLPQGVKPKVCCTAGAFRGAKSMSKCVAGQSSDVCNAVVSEKGREISVLDDPDATFSMSQ